MTILVFDSALTGCAAALYDGLDFHATHIESERGQAELLVPMIDDLLAETHTEYSQLTGIGVTRGPGSFTGIRIGLAAARGFGLALKIPALGFSTLELMAMGHPAHEQCLVLIDTKRGDWYGQVFDAERQAVEPARIWTDEEADTSTMTKLRDQRPDMRIFAELVFKEIANGSDGKVFPPEPFYLRGAEVSRSKRAIPVIVAAD